MQEEFKDTNGVIRTPKSKGRQHNGVLRTHNYQRADNTMTNRKKKKEQTTIYKTLQINLKIE